MIELNIPLPGPRHRATGLSAEIRELASAPIGASILFTKHTPAICSSTCKRIAGPGWYRTRLTNKGVRVWKTSEPLQEIK